MNTVRIFNKELQNKKKNYQSELNRITEIKKHTRRNKHQTR